MSQLTNVEDLERIGFRYILERLLALLLALGLVACSPPDDAEGGTPEAVRPCTRRTADQDLAALRKLAEVIDYAHYGHTFPEIPIRWAREPKRGVYAYTSYSDRAIYFVRPQFRQDWSYNLDVLRHEFAHFSVGPRHGHDAIWKREYRRLRRTATTANFKDIRARSAGQGGR
jgi:hypothetical protein